MRGGDGAGARLFFGGGEVLTGFLDDQVGILFGQLLVLGVTDQRALEGGQFVGGNMAGVILAFVPALEFLMPARGMRAELAPLHGGDGGDLFEEALLFGGTHICLAH